jgi:hypothetical protein
MLTNFQRSNTAYNEVILSSAAWQRNPALAIDAAFGSARGPSGTPHISFNAHNRNRPFS